MIGEAAPAEATVNLGDIRNVANLRAKRAKVIHTC